MRRLFRPVLAGLAAALALSACTADATPAAGGGTVTVEPAAQDIEVVAPEAAAALLADAPDELVVLDVRTPQEHAADRLPGAVNLDFYAANFREQLAALDREVPYLLYCQSGNRSGQARAMMAELGFRSVTDVDGGIAAWRAAGLPLEG